MNRINFKENVSILLESDLQSEQIAINYKTTPYFRISWTPCNRCKTCKNWEVILPILGISQALIGEQYPSLGLHNSRAMWRNRDGPGEQRE